MKLLIGREVHDALADTAFRARWTALHRLTPWATVFQQVAFVATWLRYYGNRFEPILVVDEAPDGTFRFLWPLARRHGSATIVAAGDYHAEYQAWLSAPGHDDLPARGLDLLARAFSGATLSTRYLPPLLEPTPARLGHWWKHSLRREVQRGIADTHTADLQQALKSRQNRWRMNRVAHGGPVRFERLTDPVELQALLPEIMLLCDFRQAAAYDTTPFRDDPDKGPFHLALCAEPDLMHVTVLRTDARLISVQLNMVNGRDVVLCVLGQSPYARRHSPGHLHLMHLTSLLKDEGFARLDLTPEGDYKERHADAYESCWYLDVPLSSAARLRRATTRRLVAAAKGLLRVSGLDESRVSALGNAVRRSGGRGLAQAWREVAASSTHAAPALVLHVLAPPTRATEADQPAPTTSPESPFVHQGVLDRLLSPPVRPYEPGERQSTIQRATDRLSRDDEPVILTHDQRLAGIMWIAPAGDRLDVTDKRFSLRVPTHTVVLHTASTPRAEWNDDDVSSLLTMGLAASRRRALPSVRLVLEASAPGSDALLAAALRLGWESRARLSAAEPTGDGFCLEHVERTPAAPPPVATA